MAHSEPPPNSTFRHRVARWREFFFAQKYRFDLGQSFLVIVNFTLLIITASDKLQLFFGIPRLRSLLVVIVPSASWVSGCSVRHGYSRPGRRKCRTAVSQGEAKSGRGTMHRWTGSKPSSRKSDDSSKGCGPRV